MRETSYRVWSLDPRRWIVALVALLPLFAVALTHPPAVHAGGCSPCIHWDSNMIYAGMNNGNPEGPVGENAQIHGTGFIPNDTVSFSVVSGDMLQSGTSPQNYCGSTTPKVALPGTVTTDGSGNFDYSFAWPSAANSGSWSICAFDGSIGALNASDDGPFYVMSGSPVMVSLNKPNFQAGETVPVTGLNWLPGAQRQIMVYIGPCVDCGGAPIASATTTSAADGSFTVNLTIPGGATPGNYLVSANGYVGSGPGGYVLLDVGQANSIPITVAAAIPTATTAAPTATTAVPPTATAVGTGASGAGGTGAHTSGGGDNTSLLIGLIVGLVVLFAALAGLIAYLVTKRKTLPEPGAPQQATPVPVGAMAPPAYGPPQGANAPYGIPDYGALPMPDWQDAGNAWDSGATSAFSGGSSPDLYPPPQPPAAGDPPSDAGLTMPNEDPLP